MTPPLASGLTAPGDDTRIGLERMGLDLPFSTLSDCRRTAQRNVRGELLSSARAEIVVVAIRRNGTNVPRFAITVGRATQEERAMRHGYLALSPIRLAQAAARSSSPSFNGPSVPST
jgi:hypothetical protein